MKTKDLLHLLDEKKLNGDLIYADIINYSFDKLHPTSIVSSINLNEDKNIVLDIINIENSLIFEPIGFKEIIESLSVIKDNELSVFIKNRTSFKEIKDFYVLNDSSNPTPQNAFLFLVA